MAIQYSIQKMVSDGTLSTIALGIQYLQRSDIYIRIAGEETPQSGAPSGYTWSFLDNTTLKILPVVPNGVEVVVYRRTDIATMYNIYSQNAQFDEATVDENNQQLLYIAQEYLEQGIPGAGVDIIEFIRDDGSFTYYRIKRTDGSYSDEFYVPSVGSITKVLAREALRRSYAEAGYNLVDGSFEAGGTLVNPNDVLLQESTGKAFSGPAGTVSAGTDPASGGFVDVSSKLYRDRNYIFNVADYGASPLNSGEQNHTIFLLVENLAKTVGGRVFVPPGVFLRAGDTVMDGRYALCGAHNAVQNHGDTKGSIIKYVGNYGTKVLDSVKVLIEDIAFQQMGGTDAKGIDLTQAGRSTLSRVTVDGFAGDGIVAVNGNLSSYTDIICLNNGGDGFKLAGLPTPDINCASLRNIDSRGNAGNGINLDSAWNVMGFGLAAQSNTGYGVVVNNCRQSFLIIYSENNTAGSIHYTDHPNNEGNFIFESFVDVASVDDSKRENTVLKSKAGADTWSMFEEVVCKSLLIPNASALGTLRLKHDTNARHDFYAEKTGQSQTLRWKNVANLSDIDADAPIYPFIHHFVGSVVRRDRLIFANGDTAPNVSLSEFWLANNTAATTITSFAGGVDGQKIMVVFNNGNTTIQNSSTNTGIRLKGGVTKTFSQYEGATFVKNGNNWWIEV